jgi:hypothetical protein
MILVISSAAMWLSAGVGSDREPGSLASFQPVDSYQYQATAPQVVVGPEFTTTLTLKNRGATACSFYVLYHKGAETPATGPLLTNGEDLGIFISDQVAAGGVKELELTAPTDSTETFEGAATFEVDNQGCADAVDLLTDYQFTTLQGQLREVFSYPAPLRVPPGVCGVVPVHYDSDASDELTRTPGFAAVSIAPLTDAEICHTLLDAGGNLALPSKCEGFDGSHQTALLNQVFPELDGHLLGSWRYCLKEAAPSSVPGRAVGIDLLYIDVVKQSSVVQFASKQHALENMAVAPGPNTASLLDERFIVEVEWMSQEGSQPGRLARVTDDTALFVLDGQWRIWVDIINACHTESGSDGFLVHFGGFSPFVEWQFSITDTVSDEVKVSAQTTSEEAIYGTFLFDTCP